MTFTNSKGREADYVYLYRLIQKPVWENMYIEPGSERRLIFTACTRAIKRLFVFQSEFDNRRKRQYCYEITDFKRKVIA